MQLRGRKTALPHLGRILIILGMITLGVVGFAPHADAAGGTPITDYGSYPAALPAGCPDGPGALVGLQFGNGRGGTASSLWGFDVRHGDTVTMSWTGFAPACLAGGNPAITVSLAAYDNPAPQFDAELDQHLVDGWAACGVDAGPCTFSGGRYRLQVTIPSPEVCNVQLDGVLGLPLAVVGPSGSFYSSGARGLGPNRLLSAATFDLNPCPPPATTTTAGLAPTSTVPAPTSTTAGPSPTTTVSSTSTSEAIAPNSAGTVPPAVNGVVAPSVIGEVPLGAGPAAPAPRLLAAPSADRLPITGTDTFATLRIAAWLAIAGGLCLAAAGILHRRRAATA